MQTNDNETAQDLWLIRAVIFVVKESSVSLNLCAMFRYENGGNDKNIQCWAEMIINVGDFRINANRCHITFATEFGISIYTVYHI